MRPHHVAQVTADLEFRPEPVDAPPPAAAFFFPPPPDRKLPLAANPLVLSVALLSSKAAFGAPLTTGEKTLLNGLSLPSMVGAVVESPWIKLVEDGRKTLDCFSPPSRLSVPVGSVIRELADEKGTTLKYSSCPSIACTSTVGSVGDARAQLAQQSTNRREMDRYMISAR